MTVNDLVGQIAARARELVDSKTDIVRMTYPEYTQTHTELIRLCKERRLSKGEMIEHILIDDFSREYDFELE